MQNTAIAIHLGYKRTLQRTLNELRYIFVQLNETPAGCSQASYAEYRFHGVRHHLKQRKKLMALPHVLQYLKSRLVFWIQVAV